MYKVSDLMCYLVLDRVMRFYSLHCTIIAFGCLCVGLISCWVDL